MNSISPSLTCSVMTWWVGLFGQLGSPLSLSFPAVFHIPFVLPLGGVEDDGGGDGVGGGFGRLGCLVCQAGHVITSLQVHDWPLCILVYQTGIPSTCFYAFVNSTLNFKICTLLLLYSHTCIIYFCPIESTRCVDTIHG